MPAKPELSTVLKLVQGRRKILDLGAGAGRIADPLACAGYEVVAVDESAEMLAHIYHATPLRSRIEDFRSEARYDAVLLLSHLVNTTDDGQRDALLQTAARHLTADGIVVLQRLDPNQRLRSGNAALGEVALSLLNVDDSRWPVVAATTRYRVGGHSWDQPWQMIVLDDEATARALANNGLRPGQMDRAWVVAVHADGGL